MNDKSYTNGELAVIAVANLGGKTDPVDLEDIAMELFKIAPNKFSLRKYPKHVDIHLVRVSLSHMALEQRNPCIKGSIKSGYMLSPTGIRWIQQNISNFNNIQESEYRKGSEFHSLQVEINRIKKTKAFHQIIKGNLENISINSLYEFLRINEYFSQKKVLSRIHIIENSTILDEEVKSSWEFLKTRFKEELSKYE